MGRRGDYKYWYYVNDMAEPYDLSTDLEEIKNLALLPQYKSRVEKMKNRLFSRYRPSQAERT